MKLIYRSETYVQILFYLEENLLGHDQQLGVVSGDSLVIGDAVNVSVVEMTDNWANAIERRL